MVRIVVLLAILLQTSLGSAEETVPFDLENPPKAQPGKVYRLEISPGKDAKKVVLHLTTTTEKTTEPNEEPWTAISKITEVGHVEHPIDNDFQTLRLEVADYDGDGYQDFRFPTSSGTGGTWYGYFRFDGKHYVPWPEPEELEINDFDLKTRTATASSRSGPAYLTNHYKIEGGKFIHTARETFDKAEALRDRVPKEIADSDYVLIVEKIEKGVVVSRKVTKREPGEEPQ